MKYAFGEDLGVGLFDNFHVHVAVKPSGAALIYVRLWDHSLISPVPEKYLGIDIAADGTISSMAIIDPAQIHLQLNPIFDNLQSIGLTDEIVDTVDLWTPYYKMCTDPNPEGNALLASAAAILGNTDPVTILTSICGLCKLMPKEGA